MDVNIFTCFVPVLPPGINSTYGYGKGKVYKKPKAVKWEADAGLLYRNKSSQLEWEDLHDWYFLEIIFTSWRMDVDAPLKLIQDALTRALGFDDKKIRRVCIEKIPTKEATADKGVFIKLEPYKEIENEE